ncbi:nucleotide-binding oligomerization domain-containing protein 2-like [Ptychodera flava]|uniref:nucleotide-binding oligomerization domain-containing protein 2-like n=1 Tax=Ptychodera flava TaxID=63121 RepID=UPI00396A5D10
MASNVVNLCQKSLQETYDSYSNIAPFPWWDGTDRLKLEDIYTELELQTKDGKKTDIAETDIFSPRDDCGTPRRIIIEGDPGYGKTTFCKKMAADWDKSDLWNYIQHNQSEICIIFDGLDEVPVKKLPSYFQDIVDQKFRKLKKSVVVVTSRMIREKNEKQHYDTQLCIKGFDDLTFKEFVKKHFKATHANEVHDGSFVMESFLRKLDDLANKDVLSDLSKSPLMALMLCDIAIENETLPETVTKLYTCLVDIVVKRYLAKGNYSEEAAAKMRADIVKALSEIAYESSGKIKDKDQHVLKIGFLTTASKPLSSGSLRYKFVHKTFQEYFAARYLSDLPPDETDILRH